MALKLPDSAVPMGDFPVAKAVDIDFNDGENLQEKLDNGTLGGASSEKQIKDWVSGSSYLEGDYIYHEGEIYRCLASNNDVDFDETNWKQLTYGIDELSSGLIWQGTQHLQNSQESSIYDYCKNNFYSTRICGFRLEPEDASGYFGLSSITILYCLSTVNYGWILGISDKSGLPMAIIQIINREPSKWQKIATQKDLDDLFQSVSNGKTLVANAITGKGVSTATDATFATMATNISKITGYKEETVNFNNTSYATNRLVFTFSADVIAIKRIAPPSSDVSSNIVPETTKGMFTVDGKKLTLYAKGTGTWEVTAIVRNA